jgi:hypothetical protein
MQNQLLKPQQSSHSQQSQHTQQSMHNQQSQYAQQYAYNSYPYGGWNGVQQPESPRKSILNIYPLWVVDIEIKPFYIII